jgi:Cyclic nucleotide-binding domain
LAASPRASAAVLDEVAGAADPWVRLGAAAVAEALRGSDRPPASSVASPPPSTGGARDLPPATPSEFDMERVLTLKRVPLFRYLPLDTLLAVGRVLERRRYVAGETICGAGRRSDYFGIVESGAVEVAEAGRPPERLVAPAYFGELALVDELSASPRVVAVEDCVLLRLHRIVFHDLSRDHPDILMELCRLLVRRVRPRRDPAPVGGSSDGGA